MSNKQSYKELWDVLKIYLILSHGNASVESGFSINKFLLVENLLEESLAAQRRLMDGIDSSGGVDSVEMSSKLLSNVKSSHNNYVRYLEEKKKEKVKEDQSNILKRKRSK